jgi:hypothetical protein
METTHLNAAPSSSATLFKSAQPRASSEAATLLKCAPSLTKVIEPAVRDRYVSMASSHAFDTTPTCRSAVCEAPLDILRGAHCCGGGLKRPVSLKEYVSASWAGPIAVLMTPETLPDPPLGGI